jgi:Meckel syndrome type 1 protein
VNTPNMPPMEPLDAQEREFARILHALPGGEPPPALDAAILRAATNAAAASRRPGARMLASAGALWGIGSAAAAVLAIGVAWQMNFGADHAPAPSGAPQAQMVSDKDEDEAVPVDLGESRAAAPAAAPAAPPAVLQQPAPVFRQKPSPGNYAANAPAAAAPPSPAPEPYPADHLDEHVAARAAAGSAAPAPEETRSNAIDVASAESSTVLTAEQAKSTSERDRREAVAAKAAAPPVLATQAAAAGGRADDAADSAAVAGFLGADKEREQEPQKPATWLAEIRALRDAGQIEKARAKMVEFRKAYPKWVIPTDLAPLL